MLRDLKIHATPSIKRVLVMNYLVGRVFSVENNTCPFDADNSYVGSE